MAKEELLQDWLPRLWDALRDVRHNENASAEEALYELYIEMKQQTLAEKIDTMSEITVEDQLHAVTEQLIIVRDNLFRGMSKSIQKLQARAINEVLELPSYTQSRYSDIVSDGGFDPRNKT